MAEYVPWTVDGMVAELERLTLAAVHHKRSKGKSGNQFE
jgi:hypothetical protein